MTLQTKYLEDADRLLADSDFVQASEKYWGAMAEVVKAIAEQRSWQHGSHRDLRDNVSRIRRLTGDNELSRLFNAGEALHTNFYENWMAPEVVRASGEDAHRFIDKLRPLAA